MSSLGRVRAGQGGRAGAVLPISRDWSRSEIKSCNPKNQIWDNPEIKWYLSQSGCGIKKATTTATTPSLTHPHARTHTAKGKSVLGFCRDMLTPFELLRGSLASSARVGSALSLLCND